jgi:hypothetical protein
MKTCIPLAFLTFLLYGCDHPDGPLEQAVEELIRQAAAKGGKLVGVHVDLDVDFSHAAKQKRQKDDQENEQQGNNKIDKK